MSRAALPSSHRPDRLWAAYARERPSRPPVKGADILGERLRGAVARVRATRRVARRAALGIEQISATFRDLSDRAFADAVREARDAVTIAPRDRAARDRAFALAREAVRRTLGLELHTEQIIGAIAIAEGCIAEMATGEGKTVTAILPAAWLAWQNRGVHILTVNDYLAARDAETTSPAYRALDVTVGVLRDEQPHDRRVGAYACGVTYGADKQFIFDHLRDRSRSPVRASSAGLVLDQLTGEAAIDGGIAGWSRAVVQREPFAAIVDEADSILIDEAVTPAILGEDAEGALATPYHTVAEAARGYVRNEDYTADIPQRRVRLTDTGRAKTESLIPALPAFWAGPKRREELVVRALEAIELYTRDDDYVVTEGQVVIVDRSTGRLLEGRVWQLGIHQAVEAKEGVEITGDRRTIARLSYQRYFQRYERLAGMTGTAAEVAPELWRDYHTPVVRIGTHRPVVRTTDPDRVLPNEAAKLEAVAERVRATHAFGRPVLVGTRSVETSERLARALRDTGIECSVLNAHREEEEAAIIARAGERGSVTVATNMAGRGTDIKLTDNSRALGGLCVIATERHDERRVDRQLFGRAGRQGDPGHAEAFIALDDAVVAKYGLKPLIALVRRTPRSLGRPLSALLWWQAQRSASARHAQSRRQAARYESWSEIAMHEQTR